VGAALRALLSPTAVARAFYDAQCKVCQAFASWRRVLDRRGRIECVPISREAVRTHGLDLAACLSQLHVVSSDGRVRVGWDAVAFLARRCPATWLIGALGAVPPLSWLARRLYRYVAANRFALSKCRGGACRVARPAAVRRQASLHAFWTCYSLGMLPLRAIEATCFPWGRRRAWETFLNDEIARLVSLGDFSRTELVRSFVRAPTDGALPTVYELRGYNTSL
jgi:predicted DCC family thiol-disulfide oxidoreductase YuxK